MRMVTVGIALLIETFEKRDSFLCHYSSAALVPFSSLTFFTILKNRDHKLQFNKAVSL